MKTSCLALAFAFLALSASTVYGQAITSYNFAVFNQGAGTPFQTSPLPATGFTCNLPKVTVTPPVVNPTRVAIDDPANPTTRDCIYIDPGTGPLLSLPFGGQAYESTLSAVNIAGVSPPSAKSGLFTRPGTTAAAPTGLRVGQ